MLLMGSREMIALQSADSQYARRSLRPARDNPLGPAKNSRPIARSFQDERPDRPALAARSPSGPGHGYVAATCRSFESRAAGWSRGGTSALSRMPVRQPLVLQRDRTVADSRSELVQPICPGPGYIWIPGYWAYGPGGYYWVAGEWVLPPFVGALWTPGYWGWGSGLYEWHAGYWGTSVGFYGGINYGFGYTGYGYHGGYWRGNSFYYNAAANNVNTSVVHTTYRTTIRNVTTNRVSYNGGAGGITARPTPAQLAYAKQPHTASTTTQVRREQAAANNRPVASMNRERAAIATAPRQPQQRASDRHAATQAQAAPFHNAPTQAERRQTAPARMRRRTSRGRKLLRSATCRPTSSVCILLRSATRRHVRRARKTCRHSVCRRTLRLRKPRPPASRRCARAASHRTPKRGCMRTPRASKRRGLRRSVQERGRKVIKAAATKDTASDRRAMSG